MGRLPTLRFAWGLSGFALLACNTVSERDAPMATNERSQVVMQKGPVALNSPASLTVPEAQPPTPPKKPRSLCSGGSESGHPFPKKHLSRAAAKSAAELAETLSVGSGKWTWINFWAAWCAPCKEEIPRLIGFEKKFELGAAPFRLQFVSLDDDERQLSDFLESQPAAGLKASYWLKEGNEREDWLKAAAQSADAPLPFHLLVDPRGKIRCVIQGAIEDGDYAEISRIVVGH